MTNIIQADYQQLETIAASFSQHAEINTTIMANIRRGMANLQKDWEGQGSAAFFAEMEKEIFPTLQRLIGALEQAQSVTLQISQIIRAAEEEAAEPFKGRASSNSIPIASADSAFLKNDGGKTPKAVLEAKKRVEERRKDYYANNRVYSQNFGFLDRDHIEHNAGTFLKVYQEVLNCIHSKSPGTVIHVQYGRGATEYNTSYTVLFSTKQLSEEQAKEAAIDITRQILINASLRYEEHTSLGFLNDVASVAGMGTSAYSTEDLPCNVLGMEAAEAYIRGEDVREGESVTDYAHRRVLSQAGDLYTENAISFKAGNNGNKTCTPVYEPMIPRSSDPNLYTYFEIAENYRSSQIPISENISGHSSDMNLIWVLGDKGESKTKIVKDEIGSFFGGVKDKIGSLFD